MKPSLRDILEGWRGTPYSRGTADCIRFVYRVQEALHGRAPKKLPDSDTEVKRMLLKDFPHERVDRAPRPGDVVTCGRGSETHVMVMGPRGQLWGAQEPAVGPHRLRTDQTTVRVYRPKGGI